MELRRYTDADFEDIAEWGEAWGENYCQANFPKTGFIVPGVAAYFLYKTDSTCCWLENMVSNPDCEDEERAEALELLVNEILLEASRLGFKVAYACTNIGKVVERAIMSGAEFRANYVLLTKDLS